MIRKRYPLSKKILKNLITIVKDLWGIALDYDFNWEFAVLGDKNLILADGIPLFIIENAEPRDISEKNTIPTIMFFAKYNPKKKFVLVDSGAVPYIMNGADVMRPGILDCDKNITLNDVVYIIGEGQEAPIAVGKALMSGEEMLTKEKGKAVKTLHYFRDEIMEYVKGLIKKRSLS